jgi:hypothetical protein
MHIKSNSINAARMMGLTESRRERLSQGHSATSILDY